MYILEQVKYEFSLKLFVRNAKTIQLRMKINIFATRTG